MYNPQLEMLRIGVITKLAGPGSESNGETVRQRGAANEEQQAEQRHHQRVLRTVPGAMAPVGLR
eukprot:5804748-Lingulodinium_polyedra.AAC.1